MRDNSRPPLTRSRHSRARSWMSLMAGLVLAVAISSDSSAQEWAGVEADIDALDQALEAASPIASTSDTSPEWWRSSGIEIRALASTPTEVFAAQVLHLRCSSVEACRTRAVQLRRALQALRQEYPEGLIAAREAGALRYVSAEAAFPAAPVSTDEEILYRAAADVWWSNAAWADVQDPAAEPSDRRILVTRLWSGLIERNRIAALDWIGRHGFPSDRAPNGRQLVAALVYAAQHGAVHYPDVAAIRMAAQRTFTIGDLSPVYMAQLLDIERAAYDGHQVLGHQVSCGSDGPFFDPPLLDAEDAARLRADYNLSPPETYLRQTGRALCPPGAAE